MKQLIKSVLGKLGWRISRVNQNLPAFGPNSFFPLLKSLGFAPQHIIDVGANHGHWTREALKSFPDAQYTLVEPQDELKSNVQDLLDRNRKLRWVHAGAGDQPGTLMFNVAHRDDSSSFVPGAGGPPTEGSRQVPVAVRTLNEIVSSGDAPMPDMVKIDAEGFDLKVLAGATDLYGKTEVFLIEAVVRDPVYENTVLAVIGKMAEAGYQLLDITDLNRSPKHQVLWLCELAFIRRGSPLLKNVTSYE